MMKHACHPREQEAQNKIKGWQSRIVWANIETLSQRGEWGTEQKGLEV
jgi:hypothetical protein